MTLRAEVGARLRAAMDTDGRAAVGAPARRLGRLVFGDRYGLTLWLGLVVTLSFLWRLSPLLTDTYVVGNAVVAVGDGSLAVETLRFPLDGVGSEWVQQGLSRHEGTYYGRNYGQVALAVPLAWALEALATVVDLRLLIAAAWSLGLAAFASQVGRLIDRVTLGRIVGAALALVAFAASVAVGTDVDDRLIPLIALQAWTLVGAGLLGVLLYRLVGRVEGRQVGLAAGIATGLATPVAFWATFPKRHVLVAFLLLTGITAFAASRRSESHATALRGVAYGAMGLVAWIHALEGFFAVATLAAVDLSTASRTGRKQLAVIGLCLLVALAPTFATNAAISGNPLQPPRLVGTGGGLGAQVVVDDGGLSERPTELRPDPGAGEGVGDNSAGGSDGGTREDGGVTVPLTDGLRWMFGLLPDSAQIIVGFVVLTVWRGLEALGDLDRLFHVFVRSGNYGYLLPEHAPYEPRELSFLESAPLLGGLAVLPAVAARRLRDGPGSLDPRSLRTMEPARQTDVLVAALAVVLTVVYVWRLPLHSQLTVRYLFPVYVLGVYGLARLEPVGTAIRTERRRVVWSFVVGCAVALVGATTVIAALDPAGAEAIQAHALVHLAAAGVLAAVLLGRTAVPRLVETGWVALVLGWTGGLTTGFYLLVGLEYVTGGSYALDLSRLVAELISIL